MSVAGRLKNQRFASVFHDDPSHVNGDPPLESLDSMSLDIDGYRPDWLDMDPGELLRLFVDCLITRAHDQTQNPDRNDFIDALDPRVLTKGVFQNSYSSSTRNDFVLLLAELDFRFNDALETQTEFLRRYMVLASTVRDHLAEYSWEG